MSPTSRPEAPGEQSSNLRHLTANGRCRLLSRRAGPAVGTRRIIIFQSDTQFADHLLAALTSRGRAGRCGMRRDHLHLRRKTARGASWSLSTGLLFLNSLLTGSSSVPVPVNGVYRI